MDSNPYLTENKRKVSLRRASKRQRVQKIMRETRRSIPTLFAMVDDDEPLAKTLGISRADLLSEAVRHLYRKMPQSETAAMDRRKQNVISIDSRKVA